MSAPLTATMPYMKAVIEAPVGGAPLNEQFATAIGADAYCRDAAVETAKEFMARKHNRLAESATG